MATSYIYMYMALRHDGAILETQLDLKRERIAESARLVLHLPLKSRPRKLRTAADSRWGDSEGNERRKVTGTARAPGARGFPEPRAPRPSPPLRSPHSLPRPSPPDSLKSPRTEMGVTAPGTSGNKTQRRPRGGCFGGESPGTTPACTGPHSPPPLRPHSPARNRPCCPRPHSKARWEQQRRGLHGQRLSG